MKDDWRGTPFCITKHITCNHPEVIIGQATPCWKCHGSGVKTITEELKEHPFNHNAMRDRYLREIAYSEAKKTKQWDEVKGKHYYTVGGEQIWDWKGAAEKWLAYQLFAEIVANPEVYFPPNKCTACLYCPEDRLCMLSGKVRTIKSNTVACEQHFRSKELFYAT